MGHGPGQGTGLRRLIERDLPKAKAAVAGGDEGALRKFFADARTILELEHAVWSYIRPSDDDEAR